MEKVLNFGGRDVKFRASARALLVYKRQFGREYLADVNGMLGLVGEDENGKKTVDFSKLDTETLCRVAWTLAYTADSSTPPMDDWLDSFDDFPVIEILTELLPMLNSTLKVDRKNA